MVPSLISESYEYYNKPKTITIANMRYKNVDAVDSRRFIDGDNVEKTINDIEARDGRYVCIANENKVEHSMKQYRYPVTRKLGGKTYHNIHMNYIGKDGSKIYEMYNNGFFNKVKVTTSGEVLDYNAIQRQKIKEFFLKPFKSAANLLRKIR
ncbi:MAG: hypothetical protein NC200_01930 [Candidatus Gastranaerophilales bacterium]|nr:hypothetical protein [Candidatus Gastranaerophilales bacterium]